MPTNSVLAPLLAFREAVYAALGPRRDALFDLLDALLVCGSVPSLAHLSLAPAHRRGHGSLYAALAHGGLDPAALRPLLAAQPLAGGAALYAVDVSVWPRPTARTSPQRGYCHASARQGYGRPVVAGWAYQWISQLDLRRDSWTAPVEVARVPPTANANAVAAQQIAGLCHHLARAQVWPDDHLLWFLFDAGYDVTQLALALEDALTAGRLALLVRVRADRCFRADPPPKAPKTSGRPRVHGAPFKCADPTTWPGPTAEHTTTDAQYGRVRVRAWAGLHGIPRDHAGRGRRDQRGHLPIIRGTLLLVEVERLPRGGGGPAPKPLWLWWQGPAAVVVPDLERAWRAYVRRFDLEHTFRFDKQELNWTTPRLRQPEQADRWTWLVLLADTHLRLARALVADARLPWQRPLAPGQLTPGRVRRAFSALLPALGTPARAVQPCGRSPGRPPGQRSPPAPRYLVVKTAARTHP